MYYLIETKDQLNRFFKDEGNECYLQFITNNDELKSAYNHYGETSKIANLVNKQPLNIDICSYADIKNNLILNRKTYQDYFKKFIKFKGEKKFQPEIIIKKLKNDRIWI